MPYGSILETEMNRKEKMKERRLLLARKSVEVMHLIKSLNSSNSIKDILEIESILFNVKNKIDKQEKELFDEIYS